MKRYIAVLEIDDEEIIDAKLTYSYSSNGMTYRATERIELKAEDEGQRMKTYEDGLNEAWEAARRIFAPVSKGGLRVAEAKQIFNKNDILNDIFDNYSALEAITKIKEYEEEQEEAAEIKVGDEIRRNNRIRVILSLSNDGWATALSNSDVSSVNLKFWEKTGRHFSQVAEMLKQMQENE